MDQEGIKSIGPSRKRPPGGFVPDELGVWIIDEIVFQTNVLAFNIAVEAVRAGEAGIRYLDLTGGTSILASTTLLNPYFDLNAYVRLVVPRRCPTLRLRLAPRADAGDRRGELAPGDRSFRTAHLPGAA